MYVGKKFCLLLRQPTRKEWDVFANLKSTEKEEDLSIHSQWLDLGVHSLILSLNANPDLGPCLGKKK